MSAEIFVAETGQLTGPSKTALRKAGVAVVEVADNIVPVCFVCHGSVTDGLPGARRILRASLTDSERAYVVGKLGEDGLVRLFGVAG